jgi:FKBP-type peptidyl-prolyl cis-trans isomerase
MFRTVLILLSAVLLAASCQSDAHEANIAQEKAIDEYVKSNFAENVVEHVDGVTRVLLEDLFSGQGALVEKGDSLFFYFAGFTLENGQPSFQFVEDSATVAVGKNNLIRGLDRGLVGTRVGQEVLLLFSSQYGYGRDRVGLVPENTGMAFEVAVARVIKKK